MQFTVAYNGNGATGGSVPVDGNAYAVGAQVTVLGNTGNLTKTGDTFARWNTKADGTGDSYGFPAPGSFTMGSNNVVLYAQWYTTAGLTDSGHGPGVTLHYVFAYQESLRGRGLEPARTNAVIAACESDYQIMSGWFGGTITLNSVISVPIRVFVADLGGGANATSVITLRPGKGNASDIRFLLVAEIVEYFMHAQNKGWFAPDGTSEQSCGEALSRFLSQQFLVQAGLGVSKPGFEISPQWLNSSLPAANPSSTQLKPLTTLPAPIDNVVTSFSVAAAQTIPFATSYIIQIDGEQLLVTAVNAKANRLAVTRGYNGTTAAAHAAQSEVFHNYGSRADYVNLTLEYDHGVSPAPGCGMLFLYYLYVQFGFSINAIIAAAPGVNNAATCLRGVYQNLTGDHGDPFPYFKQLLDNAFPPDEVSLIPGPNPDNPFPLTPLRSQDTIANIANAVALAGYYAKDDDTQHVIAGTSTGDLVEVYWKPAQGVHQDVLAQFSASIVGIGAYYAADDNTQHAIVATADGVVTEVYWKPAQGVHQDVVAQLGRDIVGIAGYYAEDDHAQHAIAGTGGGTLIEVFWRPGQGIHRTLPQFGTNIVSVGGYYSQDDHTQHAIIATSDGVLTEIYWRL